MRKINSSTVPKRVKVSDFETGCHISRFGKYACNARLTPKPIQFLLLPLWYAWPLRIPMHSVWAFDLIPTCIFDADWQSVRLVQSYSTYSYCPAWYFFQLGDFAWSLFFFFPSGWMCFHFTHKPQGKPKYILSLHNSTVYCFRFSHLLSSWILLIYWYQDSCAPSNLTS